MVNSFTLRERIEQETGMNFGMHKPTAFLTFRVRKTDSHKVTYSPGLPPDWVLDKQRHPKPTPPYHLDTLPEEPQVREEPVLAGRQKRTRRRPQGD
ncbi:MAG TPA: hypothetical protein VN711_01845 [Candidatus Saccharimonadales bacterium]|nr:hypothetical protein [Candidatus Saccharimonadales bacterium]